VLGVHQLVEHGQVNLQLAELLTGGATEMPISSVFARASFVSMALADCSSPRLIASRNVVTVALAGSVPASAPPPPLEQPGRTTAASTPNPCRCRRSTSASCRMPAASNISSHDGSGSSVDGGAVIAES
jgi:hypothetical protein